MAHIPPTKTIRNKSANIMNLMQELKSTLLFEGLPEDNRRDFYKAIDQMKVFYDNIPQPKEK